MRSRQSPAVTFERLCGTFVAKAARHDITEPLDAETVECLDGAMMEHTVLMFEETGLDKDSLHRCAPGVGELDIAFNRSCARKTG